MIKGAILMAKTPPVICPQCHETFSRDNGIENVDWVHIKNRYWHKNCYEIYLKFRENVSILNDDVADDRWFQELKDYLWFNAQLPEINFAMIQQQWNSYLKKRGYTAKGIYFTIRYFYEVKKGDGEKANGGIGIVPFIYKDAANYWKDHRDKMETIITAISRQKARLEHNGEPQRIVRNTKKTKKILKVLDFDEIEGDD